MDIDKFIKELQKKVNDVYSVSDNISPIFFIIKGEYGDYVLLDELVDQVDVYSALENLPYLTKFLGLDGIIFVGEFYFKIIKHEDGIPFEDEKIPEDSERSIMIVSFYKGKYEYWKVEKIKYPKQSLGEWVKVNYPISFPLPKIPKYMMN